MKSLLRFLLVQICLMGAGFAGPSFNRLWKEEMEKTAPASSRGIAGPWEGTWKSEKNGHTGALRCLVEPQADGKYLFRYWAQWCDNMKGTFALSCEVKRSGGDYSVKGTKNLGLFGTYHHEGVISARQFDATFRSNRKNLGTFRLLRPEGWKP